jgi:hypothetical protein
MIRLAPLLLLVPFVSACSADTTAYPSLAPRAAEREGFEEPAAAVAAAPAADPALDARIAALLRERAAAAAAFDAGATRAERAARLAAGAAAGSDRWLDAQTALAELDSLRATHADAIGGLEELASARALALAPPYPALERALTEARAAAAAQTRRIDAVAALLAPAR